MGCDSPDSNFNNHVFDGKKWWVRSGWDYTYQAPIGYLSDLMDKLGVSVDEYTIMVDKAHENWIATPRRRRS